MASPCRQTNNQTYHTGSFERRLAGMVKHCLNPGHPTGPSVQTINRETERGLPERSEGRPAPGRRRRPATESGCRGSGFGPIPKPVGYTLSDLLD